LIVSKAHVFGKHDDHVLQRKLPAAETVSCRMKDTPAVFIICKTQV
jgi:hypothetical protein